VRYNLIDMVLAKIRRCTATKLFLNKLQMPFYEINRLMLVQTNEVNALEYLVSLYLQQANDLPLDRPELLMIIQSKRFKHKMSRCSDLLRSRLSVLNRRGRLILTLVGFH